MQQPTITLIGTSLPTQARAPRFAPLPDGGSPRAIFGEQFRGLLTLIPDFSGATVIRDVDVHGAVKAVRARLPPLPVFHHG